jgi:hypothetical protein
LVIVGGVVVVVVTHYYDYDYSGFRVYSSLQHNALWMNVGPAVARGVRTVHSTSPVTWW